jgi:hypothetical protein
MGVDRDAMLVVGIPFKDFFQEEEIEFEIPTFDKYTGNPAEPEIEFEYKHFHNGVLIEDVFQYVEDLELSWIDSNNDISIIGLVLKEVDETENQVVWNNLGELTAEIIAIVMKVSDKFKSVGCLVEPKIFLAFRVS